MDYIGIDLHRDNFRAVVLDEDGERKHLATYKNTRRCVEQLLAACSSDKKAVVEATRNWMWLVEDLQKKGCDVTLAHPLKLKAIVSAKIKNDTIDATTLANLLRTDYVPGSYIATSKEQEHREIARTRISLVKLRTWSKNQIHAILAKQNIRCPVVKDLFSQKGLGWLKEAELTEARRVAVDNYLKVLEVVEERISELEKLMNQWAETMPEIGYLTSIPGIGTVTAFTLAAEIGDINRFKTAKKLTSYMGIVPRIYHSGKTRHYGRITKEGSPYVRWLLGQTAYTIMRKDPNLKLWYASIANRSGKKKAAVAVARKVLVLCWVVLKEKRPYESRKAKKKKNAGNG